MKQDETRNYVLEEIKDNELISEKHKQMYKVLNCFEQFLIFISAVSGCVSISAFALLAGISVGVASSAIGLKVCAITAGIKKYKSVIKKKRKKTRSNSVISKT